MPIRSQAILWRLRWMRRLALVCSSNTSLYEKGASVNAADNLAALTM